jgi:hypothetical protein
VLRKARAAYGPARFRAGARTGVALAEQAGDVALPRPLLIVPVLLALAAPASAAPGTGSGGALAEPLRQGPGGGALAPERSGASEVTEPSPDGGGAVAEAARNGPRAAPQWEAEPPERERAPYPAVDAPAGEAASTGATEARTVAGVKAARAEGEPTGGDRVGGGSLTWTGLEIAALAAIGLGVLTLGAALRPRRRERTRALR